MYAGDENVRIQVSDDDEFEFLVQKDYLKNKKKTFTKAQIRGPKCYTQ